MHVAWLYPSKGLKVGSIIDPIKPESSDVIVLTELTELTE
jgi:hypothetical protein